MARLPRIEFPGAVYHLSARCEPGLSAFAAAEDCEAFLALLAQTLQRFDAQALAYCLLPEQYLLLLYTRQANLSRLMRHLNGVHTQEHNRRHGRRGPLFHGRFKAVLVDRDRHLLASCRSVELAPQQQGLVAGVADLADWPWSSYRAHIGRAELPAWLDAEGLWTHLLGRPPQSSAERRRAAALHARTLAGEPALQLWPGRLRRQIFLGDADFVERMLDVARRRRAGRPRNPAAQLAIASVWADWLARSASREQALLRAHTEGGLTMTALAAQLGLSLSRVSRLIASEEARLRAP